MKLNMPKNPQQMIGIATTLITVILTILGVTMGAKTGSSQGFLIGNNNTQPIVSQVPATEGDSIPTPTKEDPKQNGPTNSEVKPIDNKSEQNQENTVPSNLSHAAQKKDDDQHSEIVVHQGDEILFGISGGIVFKNCTLGFFDKNRNQAYTAAHCMLNPEEEGTVFINKNGSIVKIGTIKAHQSYSDFHNRGNKSWGVGVDLAMVTPLPGVSFENTYSGDNLFDYKELRKGDMICHYGSATRQKECSPIEYTPYPASVLHRSPSTYGDSGGPMWVENNAGDPLGVIAVIRGGLNSGNVHASGMLIAMRDWGVNGPEEIIYVDNVS